MPYYLTAVTLAAGICLGFGILYLFIGLRRHDNKALNLTFALFALCYAATLFNGLRWYTTNSVTEFVAINRVDQIFVAGAFVSLAWYIAYYTGVRPRIFLGVLSATIIGPGLVFIISPATVIGEVSGLTDITLPWGEKLTDLDMAGTVWFDILLLARLVLLGYIIFALIRQFRRGGRRPALILGLGILPFIAAIFYEILGESGVVPYIPVGEMGFLGIAIAASLQMANSVIKTEEALAEHRQNLEGLVATRTTELSRSNEQLTAEVERREQTEIVLRASEERFRKVFEESPIGMALVAPDFHFARVNEALCRMLGYTAEELLARTFPDITHPDDVEKDLALARQLFSGQLPYYQIEKRYQTRSGAEIRINLTAALFRDREGQPAFGLAMIEDITERWQAGQVLNRRVEELAILHETAQTVASLTDLTTALQQVSETINYLYAARYTHLLVPAANGTGLQVIGFEQDIGPIEPAPVDIPMHELPMLGEVLDRGQSLVFPNIQSQPLHPTVRDFIIGHNIQSTIMVPLLTHGKAIGVMAIATDQGDREFTPGEISLAETIAVDIAAAVENSRLLEQAKVGAAIEERNRIARELHDSVTQTMYSVSLVAEALPRVLERNLDEAKRNAGYLRQTTLGALAEMRTLLFELRPDSLAKARLNVLLQQLADALTGRTRVPVEVMIQGQATVPAGVKIALYRIAQEACNNINKHAKASRAWLTLQREPDRVILVIRDNGQGFNPAAVPAERLGLRIMRERAVAIGANLTLESAPGQGVQLTVTWADPAGQFIPESESSS